MQIFFKCKNFVFILKGEIGCQIRIDVVSPQIGIEKERRRKNTKIKK
jgi:hypothetical protein